MTTQGSIRGGIRPAERWMCQSPIELARLGLIIAIIIKAL